MAIVKFTGEEALGRVAEYVNKKLAFASSMPESPETGIAVLYIGTTTSSFQQGGIYEYDGTNWVLINSNVNAVELTQAEYNALPSATKLNGTIYFITDAGTDGGNEIVQGYYNPADGKFYEENTYVTEITPSVDCIYIDLGGNKLYRYNSGTTSYVELSGGSADNIIWAYYNSEDGKFYEDSSYITEITPNAENIYIDLGDNKIYRYDITDTEYVIIGGEEIDIDPTPIQGSTNAVQSGGVYTALDGKVDKVTGKGLSTNDYTNADAAAVAALGTASTKNVAAGGDASTTQVVMGNDSRLSDARPASDVLEWAKAATKPTYTATEVGAIASTEKGTASGVAELDANGKVPSSQLPSYVDDVKEGYLNSADGKFYEESTYETEITPEADKIYVDKATNITYRWSGSAFVAIGSDLALGETSTTAYRGDRGKAAYDHANDADKISTATASGFYKVGATAEGHVSDLTAVTKADITALGIPDADNLGTAATKDSTSTITSGSTDLIEGGAVYTALQGKADSAGLGTAAAKDFTTSVTSGSADLVTSGGVYTYVDTVITQALNGSY